ncbi:hypothetical protein LRE75_23595, partial [Streptomyces sp. 372A]
MAEPVQAAAVPAAQYRCRAQNQEHHDRGGDRQRRFVEEAVLEAGAGSDEGDEVRCGDRSRGSRAEARGESVFVGKGGRGDAAHMVTQAETGQAPT